jgi:hypothetical protein
MSGGTASLAALAVLLVACLTLECSARRGHGRATAAQAIGAAMRTTAGRTMVLATWLWLGVHFLAR